MVTFFDFAMEQIMRLGGDTDTNACIVGAAVGAFVTADHLPQGKLQKVLECDIRQGK